MVSFRQDLQTGLKPLFKPNHALAVVLIYGEKERREKFTQERQQGSKQIGRRNL